MRRDPERASLHRMRAWAQILMIAAGCGTGGADPPPPVTAPPRAEAPSRTEASPQAQPTDSPKDASSPETHERTAPEALVDPWPALAARPTAASTSQGSPTHGHLAGSVALPLEAPGLRFLPNKDPGSRYGTVELVRGLVAAAAAVERAEPGAPVSIGDLSREEGGSISGHASHRSGRDVDVLFYLRREADDTPFVPSKFIPLDPEGRGTDYLDLADPSDDVPVRIDAPRTWAFVAALLAHEEAKVQRILVVEHLRTLLLQEAERAGAPAEIVQRFSEVTCQPKFPHDDHMHIRVFCSPDDIEAGCEDTAPIFPWRKRELKALGLAPLRVGEGKASIDEEAAEPEPRPELKTLEQARAEAGPMHEDVVEFLDRRKAWASKPHPGRRWCR